MKKLFYFISIFSLLIFSTSAVSATFNSDTIYILRVTSDHTNNKIPFNATYMAITNHGTKIENIEQTTPAEYIIKANYIGVMLEIKDKSSNVKVDIAERTHRRENIKLTGSGHSIFAHESIDGNGYILAE